MSLLLKALKQAEASHTDKGSGRDESGLELEPLAGASAGTAQAREWVEPPGLLFGNTDAAAGSPQARRFRWPRLSLIPATLLLAAMVAVGYGIYLYFALQPPVAQPQAPAAMTEAPLPAQPVSPQETLPITPLAQAQQTTPVSVPSASPAARPPRPATAAPDRPRATPAAGTPGEARPLPQFQADPQTALLGQAYAAYQRGTLAEAQRLYAQAHTQQRSTDALLGLAAIAVLQDREADAQRLYREVLDLDPRNTTAQAALLDLLGNTDGAATESRLKSLIEREPSPQLHQTLGNLYAEQGRWRDAQAAYFEAWRGAPGNGDYAFNLAVSLDQLREYAAALTYYEKALASGGAHRFDRNHAVARVQQLKQAR
ncbi:MAG: tetratricopeptide repeat protein [Gammaproteobacteria bacterium]